MIDDWLWDVTQLLAVLASLRRRLRDGLIVLFQSHGSELQQAPHDGPADFDRGDKVPRTLGART